MSSCLGLQVKKVLTVFKKLCESHRELGCAAALHHELRAQVCVTPASTHVLHCHHASILALRRLCMSTASALCPLLVMDAEAVPACSSA